MASLSFSSVPAGTQFTFLVGAAGGSPSFGSPSRGGSAGGSAYGSGGAGGDSNAPNVRAGPGEPKMPLSRFCPADATRNKRT